MVSLIYICMPVLHREERQKRVGRERKRIPDNICCCYFCNNTHGLGRPAAAYRP